ncbi:MAG: hypothetical protein ACK55I_34975, partial [bacterium]
MTHLAEVDGRRLRRRAHADALERIRIARTRVEESPLVDSRVAGPWREAADAVVHEPRARHDHTAEVAHLHADLVAHEFAVEHGIQRVDAADRPAAALEVPVADGEGRARRGRNRD